MSTAPRARQGLRIRLGISACLLGDEVRYDGGHKRDPFLTEVLGRFVDWVKVCPEVESGMGTPREAIRLVDQGGAIRLLTVRTGVDHTASMTACSAKRVHALDGEDLCGYVLKKDSPSCGMTRVKVYTGTGPGTRTGVGVFAQALLARFPHLPVEEEGRLTDPRLRDNFIERVFAYRRLRDLFESRWTVGDLVRFHTAHQFVLLAHSTQAYSRLGRLVAGAKGAGPGGAGRALHGRVHGRADRHRDAAAPHHRPPAHGRLRREDAGRRIARRAAGGDRRLSTRSRAAHRPHHAGTPSRPRPRRGVSGGTGLPRAPPEGADAPQPRVKPNIGIRCLRSTTEGIAMTLWQDLRYAARLLVKDRWFTAIAATALALGIGVNATMFTIVNAVLIRGLPFAQPARIISIGMLDARGRPAGVSRLDFYDWRDGSRAFSGLTLFLGSQANVSDEGRPPEQFNGTYQSANMFAQIGQRPVIGRDFTVDDDQPGAAPVVILGNGIWKSRYGSDPNILTKSIKVNSLLASVIGVMPPDMKFPFNNELWLPVSMLPPELTNSKRNVRNFQVLGRLGDGVTLAQARSEIVTIAAKLAKDYPDTNKDFRPDVMTFDQRVAPPQLRLIFLSLMGAVAFVLLIAIANVANLLLGRATGRSREIAVRVSLGAGRWRIVRQLLVESVLLAALSGVLGLALSTIGIKWFDSVVTTDVGKPYWMTFTMDPIVFVFLTAVCLATGILFGLAPALHVSKTDINEVMKEGGGRSGTAGPRARRWTSALIVGEIALTVVLLAGAGFMMRSFMALYRMDLGFETSQLLTMRLTLPLTKYPKGEPRTALYQRLEERLRGVSAIQAAALTSSPPMFGGFLRQLTIDGRPLSPGDRAPEVTVVSVSAGYFDTLGVRLVRGRTFNDADGTPGHESAIVNQRFVAMHFPGEDPVGQHIRLLDTAPVRAYDVSPAAAATIVGVVPTVRQRNFQEPDPDPVAYLPYRADPQRFVTLIVRSRSDPSRITPLVREEMRALEPDLPLFQIQTMDQLLAQLRFSFRVFGSMFAIFAVIALALSAVGLYAVTAYSVAQRTQEIGVRMALGAQPEQVLWLVLRRALVQLAIGLPIGVAGAFAVGRLMQSVLAQTSGRDPLTIGAIALLMCAVSLAACVWPAHRATRLDPVAALRNE
jgi:putative ABC transport system permease protein